MEATKHKSIVRRMACVATMVGAFAVSFAGCGVSDYETALNESIENRKEEIRLIEELRRKAAENPNSGPAVDYSKMSKEELVEQLQTFLDKNKEEIKKETGEEELPPEALDAKRLLGE